VPEKHFLTADKVVAATTDLLHRRIFLPYSLQFSLRESVVLLKTNSTLMSEVFRRLELPLEPVSEVVNATWEIAVETERESGASRGTEPEIGQTEIYRFGSSCAVRMSSGSWFAHTPPAFDGVGFAMVTGDECDQIHQLFSYLQAILNLIDAAFGQSLSSQTLEVTA
jgi:hypothetical protein